MLTRRSGDKLLESLHLAAPKIQRPLLLTALVVTFVGCGNILGIDDIESCWNPSGFDGRGCYRTDGGCKLTKEQLPNACTDSPCIPFDNEGRLGLSLATDLPKITNDVPVMIGSAGTGTANTCPMTNRVVVVGSNAIKPIVRHVSAELSVGTEPITVLYQALPSCDGAATILEDLMVSGDFLYWTRNGEMISEATCKLPAQLADIGTSDVFATTCGLSDDSSKGEDTLGPIQAMIFVAPKSSAERAISAEAARIVYGFEGNYENRFTAAPWTNVDHIQKRIPTSGTQNLIGKFIGVPSASFKGQENTGTSEMISALQGTQPADATATIGILDVVNGDPVSTSLRVLAFQAEGQHCAFQPDSADGTFDRRNVRDGHYVLWGPLHIFNRPNPSTPVTNIVKFLSLETAPPSAGLNEVQTMSALIKVTKEGSLIPSCAMRVKRSSEGGSLLTLVPEPSCSCLFDKLTGGTTCAVCSSEADCQSADAPTCNFGFCEPQ